MQVNKTIFIENDRYKVLMEEAKENGEIFVFLHLDVYIWNKTVLKELRVHLESIFDLLIKDGHSITGFYVEGGKSFKFMKMLKPLDFEIRKGGHLYGGWYLKD